MAKSMQARPPAVLWGKWALVAAIMCGCSGEAPREGDTGSVTLAERADNQCVAAGASCAEANECCSQRCDMRKSSGKGLGTCADDSTLGGPLATLPASTKLRDFRAVAPKVKQIVATPATNGATNLIVSFAADPRLENVNRLLLPLDQGQLILSRKSSSEFGTTAPMAFADVLAAQTRARDLARKLGEESVPTFRGRELTGSASRPQLTPDHVVWTPGPLKIFDSARSLTINDPSVVADPTRTFNPCTGAGTRLGPWTFGRLITDMAGSMAPGDFAEAWFNTYLSAQTVNGFTVAAQPSLPFPSASLSSVLAAWPRKPDRTLDVSRAPFELIAIVNRTDLAGNPSYGAVSGAEGRFIFKLHDNTSNTCTPLNFFVIFEFGVPISSCSQMRDWAQSWLALSQISLGSTAFNTALQALTDQFATAGADPSKPNGSALNQFRSNAFPGIAHSVEKWELREFHLFSKRGAPAQLNPVSVAQTPDASYDGTRGFLGQDGSGPLAPQLGTWITSNVIGAPNPLDAPAYTVPAKYPCGSASCASFRGGAIFNNREFWRAPGPSNSQLNVFSINTCDGCHGQETQINFVQVDKGLLSAFLTGETVSDPRVSSISHTYSDLLRRKQVLEAFAGAFCGKLVPIPKLLENSVFPSPLPPIEMNPILATH